MIIYVILWLIGLMDSTWKAMDAHVIRLVKIE